jgi:multiple sugar transport system ATP-binding protein
MAQIRVEKLRKAFGDFVAVQGSTFTIEGGTFFVMLGPSGCGKTTTLRMIAGLELPSDGRILLDGEDVTVQRAAQRDIAFVFQLFALYPHMNVEANIGFPLLCQGMGGEEVRRQVRETARLLRIESLLKRKVSNLSGGDRQRVALGRAIVRRPKAFLMDEPLGALDAELREDMSAELRDLHDRIGATTVYVTHDQIEAMAMADRIAVMNSGVVEQIGTPQEIYDLPATMFVADFVGSPPMNFIHFEGRLRPSDRSVRLGEATVAIPEACEEAASNSLVLGVRPEHVSIADSAPIRGRVFGAEYLGTTQIVTVDIAQGQIKARLPSLQRVQAGETVGLAFKSDLLMLFDGASGRALQSVLHRGERHV